MTTDTPMVFVVDDDSGVREALTDLLSSNGLRVQAFDCARTFLESAKPDAPACLVLDLELPDLNGLELQEELASTIAPPIVFITGRGTIPSSVRAMKAGAVEFLSKPFREEELLQAINTAIALDRAARLKRSDCSDAVLLGDSAAAVRLRRDIEEAARSDVPLLISGPAGSDHEAVARAVHHQSRRGLRAITCVNCLSSSSDRTGAIADFVDRLRPAGGGTLYLEAIEHLSRDRQQMLAERIRDLRRVRQSAGQTDSDVRVIVSTTQDVDEELAAGRLLPDLRRLLRETLDLVPLRARLDDLPRLASHILRRQAEQAARTVPVISDESLKRLMSHRWPGNLRELRNVLGSALAACHGDVLEIGDHLLDNNLRVGSYRLLEPLGAGGMGEVWLARHQLLARPAAVKIVREAVVGLGENVRTLRQRFTREAEATAALHSPHSVQLFDFGVTDTGSFYYVMELLRGMDLQRMVERFGPLPPERTVFLLKQACLSLSEAHGLGLVHRDVKPANLFVCCRLGPEYDFLKVLDFGVVSRQGPQEPITVAGTVLGTPAFLAPELVSGQGTFDGRADIYALGCVAFCLLTGKPPFQADDAISLLIQHSKSTPIPPSKVAEEAIPAELDGLILECLSKEPALRPANVDALKQRLDRLACVNKWDQPLARAWWELHAPDLIEYGS